MTWLDCIVLILAVRGVVDTWTNEDLFAGPRSHLEAIQDSEPNRFWALLCDMLLCPHCFGHHVAFWFALALFFLPGPWGLAGRVVIYAFAAVQAVWLLEHSLPGRMRYDRGKQFPVTDDFGDPVDDEIQEQAKGIEGRPG